MTNEERYCNTICSLWPVEPESFNTDYRPYARSLSSEVTNILETQEVYKTGWYTKEERASIWRDEYKELRTVYEKDTKNC